MPRSPSRRPPALAFLILACVPAAGQGQPPAKPPAAPRKGVRTDRHSDPLPDGALVRFGSDRYRHPGGVNNSCLSADGKLLATAARGNVAVWDLATGRRLHVFRGCGVPD